MLPAGTVNHVDHDDRKVYVDRTKDQIKAAPEYDETSHSDPAYRDKLGGYYGDTYRDLPAGHRPVDGRQPITSDGRSIRTAVGRAALVTAGRGRTRPPAVTVAG